MNKNIAILIISLTLSQSLCYAGQTGSTPNSSSQSKSKLQVIQEQIDEYTEIIEELPKKLNLKIENFNRLKGLGNDIQEVLTSYVTATEECVNGTFSKVGKKACANFENLDLGTEIKEKKEKVIEMINEAERELEDVKNEQKDLPLIEKLLTSLKSSKEMLMR
jgi:hypothetical protein